MTDPSKAQRSRAAGLFHEAAELTTVPGASGPGAIAAELRPGQMIGKCRIERELGRGGMGAVYLARHTTLDVLVAIKILPPHVASRDPEFAERFLREARIAARLKHPNVVACMDVDRDEAAGIHYIVHEYIDGGSMRGMIEKGPLEEKSALRVIGGVARALVAAEKLNIVHRDIKPDNILFTKEGHVKLADLGLAKELSGPQVTQSSFAMGTPAYMSPEQIDNPKNVDRRSDIFSLGATLYQLLTGVTPFEGDTVVAIYKRIKEGPTPDPRRFRPQLSAATAALCMKMMAREPGQRYQSASEILDDIARPATQASPAIKLPRPMWLAIAGAAAVVLLIVGIVLATRGGGEPQPPVDRESTVKEPVKDPPKERPKDPPKEIPRDPPKEIPKDPPKDPPKEAPPAEAVLDAAALAKGLALSMSFDDADATFIEAGAGRVRDLSTKKNHGGIAGAPTSAEGRVGRGLKFDGIDDALECPAIVEKTVAMWVKAEFDGLSGIERQCGLYDGGLSRQAGRGFQIGIFQPYGVLPGSAQSPRTYGVFAGFGESDAVVPADAVAKGWHHLVIAWDGARVWIAVDGELKSGFVVEGGFREGTPPFELKAEPAPAAQARSVIGRINQPYFNMGRQNFRGVIDEVAVWERALSVEELKGLAGFAARGESYVAAMRKADPPEETVKVDPPKEPPKETKPSKLAEGCVLAMDFDGEPSWESGKLILKDVSGQGNDGKGTGTGMLKGKGKFGAGLSFDGNGNYAELPALAEKTVSMWIFLNASLRQELQGAVLYDGGTNAGGTGRARLIGLIRPNGWDRQRPPFADSYGIFAGFWWDDAAVPAGDMAKGWHHVVTAWDGQKVWIQVDGKRPKGLVGRLGTMQESEQPLQLPDPIQGDGGTTTLLGTVRLRDRASWIDREFFSGLLDEVAVWDRTLSEDEMKELWDISSGGKSYVEKLKAKK